MKGNDVQSLRSALGLDPTHFAQLLGIHPSTLYRWEAAKDTEIRVEPFQQQILAVLQRRVGLAPKGEVEDLGDVILKGLLVGGAMFGLYKLLEAAFSDDHGGETGGPIARGKSPRGRSSPTRRKGSI